MPESALSQTDAFGPSRPDIESTAAWNPVGRPPFSREAELAWLYRAWVNSRVDGTAVYLEGPPGVGKSVAVGHFVEALRYQSGRIVNTAARRIPPSPDAVARHLSQALENETVLADPAEALNRRGRAGGVVWVVEGYDAWRPVDRWFRAEVLGRIGPGVLLVLEGREPIQRLWAGDLAAQARVLRIALDLWSDGTVANYLASRGVDRSWIDPAVTIAAGSPALAVRMADALAADRAMAPAGAPSRIWSFLLERALHPGSRRMAWRAGFADQSLDGLVAAASLVPYFTRGLMEALVGRELLERHWAEFMELPVSVAYGPGIFGIPPRLRRAVVPLVEEARPWMSRRWQWRAARWAVEFDDLAADNPVPEAVLADILARCLRDPASPPPVLGRLVWEGDPRHDIASPPSARVRVEDADGATAAEARLAATPGSLEAPLRVTAVETAGHEPVAWCLLRGALLARTMSAGRGVTWEAAIPEDRAAFADALGLPLQGPGDAPGDRRTDLLRRIRNRILGCPATEPGESPADLVREALTALNHPERLAGSRLALRWPDGSRPTASALRRWILDALTSADLGDWPSGRLLLTLYYIERRGSHEALAERLNVSRATYFRSHQRALQRLADHLLGSPTFCVD